MKLRFLPILFFSAALAVRAPAGNHNAYPLPEDRGSAGALSALERLPVYAHVLYTIAHPDDESPGTLVWLSRHEHVRTALFSFTRGEGGQNILGPEKYEALGLLRTGELLEACRFYGVEPYFSTAIDFGFSKSAKETLEMWGEERTLEELVRFIRGWRPAIIISQFAGTAADGHGHHQAAGLLTREAFRAAGDPKMFPEQMRQGFSPWQAKILYRRARDEAPAVGVGKYDPILGRSYLEIGIEGYSKHRSQGNGARFVFPGPASDHFALIDSTLSEPPRETGLLASIDTSLTSIVDLAGDEAGSAAGLRPLLEAAETSAHEAISLFEPAHPEKAAPAVAAGLEELGRALTVLPSSSLTPAAQLFIEKALKEKSRDFQAALGATLGIYFTAVADTPALVPGESLGITARFVNRGPEAVQLQRVTIQPSGNWTISEKSAPGTATEVRGGESIEFAWSVEIPAEAAPTQPFWYRAHPSDMHYTIRPTADPFAPFADPLISLEADYSFRGAKAASMVPVRAETNDPIRGVDFVDFQLVPAVSVAVSPNPAIIPLSAEPQTRHFLVTIRSNSTEPAAGKVHLELPAGWTSQPPDADFNILRKGEENYTRFSVRIPGRKPRSNETLQADAVLRAGTHSRGCERISYPENWTRYLYIPACSDLRIFEFHVRPHLRVGYVPGAGDDVAAALQQLGAEVRVLSDQDLAMGDLAGFSAIVTGIRAYNVNHALRSNNSRLLAYVRNGGTLIVQYCRPEGNRPFAYAPFPFVISSRDRITVEESPVSIIAPLNPIFTSPNRITSGDFEGWVQERGLYFAADWDSRYTPLLSGADPGEPQLRGGMLVADYGKGHYIYTAYAWFRQLPAGVAGAYRIFANMLSLQPQSGVGPR
jgi:LmbE family N-acetylglucosaminyl deacetylase